MTDPIMELLDVAGALRELRASGGINPGFAYIIDMLGEKVQEASEMLENMFGEKCSGCPYFDVCPSCLSRCSTEKHSSDGVLPMA